MLSQGQVHDAYQKALGRTPTGDESRQYTSDNAYEGEQGQNALIAKLGGVTTVSAPASSSQVQQHLDDYHNLVLGAVKSLQEPEMSDQDRLDQIKARVLPTSPLPTAPNMVQTYDSLRADPNITGLEAKLSDIRNQENSILTQKEATQTAEEGKPVAMNVMTGRQSQEEKQAQVQLTSLARQKSAVIDELSTRYSMIQTVMQLTQTDYDNAIKNWTAQFSTNQAIYDAFNTEKAQADQKKMEAFKLAINASAQEVSWAKEQEQFEYQQAQDTIRNASANLTIYANLLREGGMSYDQLSSEQKLQIQKLEIQSGMGTGFLQTIQTNQPEGKVIYAGANGAVMQMPDGSLETFNYNVSGNKNGNPTVAESAGKIATYLSSNANSYHDVSPAVWNKALEAWLQDGYDKKTFIERFSGYADINRGDFASAYGFNSKDIGGKDTSAANTKKNELP